VQCIFSKEKQPLSSSQCFAPENAMKLVEAKKMMVRLAVGADTIVVKT